MMNTIKKMAQALNNAAQTVKVGIFKLALKNKAHLWDNIQSQKEAFEKATADEKNAMYLVASLDLCTTYSLAVLWFEVKNPSKRAKVYADAMLLLKAWKSLKEVKDTKEQANKWASNKNKEWKEACKKAYEAGQASVVQPVQQATPVTPVPEENVIVTKGTATPVSKAAC